jgi:hypothetical protein
MILHTAYDTQTVWPLRIGWKAEGGLEHLTFLYSWEENRRIWQKAIWGAVERQKQLSHPNAEVVV